MDRINTNSWLAIVHRKKLAGEKLANHAYDHEPFTKIFLTNIHKYTKNVFGICTDFRLFTKFFLANSFYLYGLPNFSHAQ